MGAAGASGRVAMSRPWLTVVAPHPAIASTIEPGPATERCSAGRGAPARMRAGAAGWWSRPPAHSPTGDRGGDGRLQRTAVGATRCARTARVCWVAARGGGSGSKPATRPASRPVRRSGTRTVRAGRRLLCATCVRKSDYADAAYPLELDRPRGFDAYALLLVDPEHGDPNVS